MNTPLTPLPQNPLAGLAFKPGALPAGLAVAAAAPNVQATLQAAPQAAFATDLAKLLALAMPAAEGAASALSLEAPVAEADPEAEGESSDALTALWAELGIGTPPAALPPVATAPAEHGRPSWLGATGPETALSAISGALQAARADSRSETGLPLQASAQAELMAQVVDARASAGDASPVFVAPGVSEAPRTSALPPAPVIVDLRQPQAAQQVAENVVWQVGETMSEVQIRLNPEDLGPLEVRLKLEGDKVAVRFDLADASVRDVVQTSLPQLATMLSARGLQLDQAQVFQQDRGQAQPQPQFTNPDGSRSDGEAADDGDAVLAPRVALRRGLVDDYV